MFNVMNIAHICSSHEIPDIHAASSLKQTPLVPRLIVYSPSPHLCLTIWQRPFTASQRWIFPWRFRVIARQPGREPGLGLSSRRRERQAIVGIGQCYLAGCLGININISIYRAPRSGLPQVSQLHCTSEHYFNTRRRLMTFEKLSNISSVLN